MSPAPGGEQGGLMPHDPAIDGGLAHQRAGVTSACVDQR